VRPEPSAPRAAAGTRGGATRIALVVPALDEERGVALVLPAVPRSGGAEHDAWIVTAIVVVDNGSEDSTADAARRLGATVVTEPRRGYGSACLAGLGLLLADPPDIVAFLDADASDDPAELPALLAPLVDDRADLVVGSRVLGDCEPGALTTVQRFGNRLASGLLRLLYGVPVTDLGPFRAIRWTVLESLGMRDRDYGWTVEMQARALARRTRMVEVPVRYRRRAAGRSKVSGTVRGVVGAGFKILLTIARVRLGG
jgi:glycosyltransferase involved in cell wall biosynthesis